MEISMTVIAGVVLTVLSCAFGTMFLLARKTENHWHSLWLKVAGSLAFVMTGVVMAFYAENNTAWIIVAGLVFGLIGDLLLGFRTIYTEHRKVFFYSGGLAFTIGHLFYISALSKTEGSLTKVTVIAFAVLMIFAVIYAFNRQKRKASTLISGAVYISFVAVVAAMAISATVHNFVPANWIFAIGGFSFFLSDNFLGAYSFGPVKSRELNIVLHITYYVAQLAIGWSILFI